MVSKAIPFDSIGAVVSRRSWSPIVALAFHFSVGSTDDPPGLEGRARVAAEGAALSLMALLDGPSVEVHVGRRETVFTVRALPDEWERALDLSFSALASAPTVEVLRQALAEHLERVAFEDGAPLSEFNDNLDRLLAGGDVPGARPIDGTLESVVSLDAAAIVVQARFTGGQLAIVGPIEPLEVATILGNPVVVPGGRVIRLDASEAALATSAAPIDETLPWSAEAREVVVAGVINSWTAAAYPAPRGIPRTQLEFVAHILEEQLDPYPPADGVFGIEAEVRDLAAGPVLVVIGTFRPDVGGGWEDRFADRVDELIAGAPPSPFFESFLKRFRAHTLLAEPAPEDEARRLVSEFGLGRVPRDLAAEISLLEPSAVTATIRRLGPPRMLRFGPPQGG